MTEVTFFTALGCTLFLAFSVGLSTFCPVASDLEFSSNVIFAMCDRLALTVLEATLSAALICARKLDSNVSIVYYFVRAFEAFHQTYFASTLTPFS